MTSSHVALCIFACMQHYIATLCASIDSKVSCGRGQL
jgi:hypothetical protein